MKTLRASLLTLLLGSSLAAGTQAQSNLLQAGDFEGPSSITGYWPATPGVWGAESATLSGPANGITPFGNQMLQVNHSGGGGNSQTAQIVTGPFVAGSTVTLTAKFNTWRSGQSARIDLMTNTGLPLDGPRYSSSTIGLDTDTATWETLSVTTTLANDTNYLAAELIVFQASGGEPYGTPRVYADEVVLTVVPPPITQTLTILGGAAAVGDIATNVEYYNPQTSTWQPAYMADYGPYGHPNGHPWGNISGTTGWINYKVSGASDPGTANNTTLWYLYRVRFTAPASFSDPTMVFSLKADNHAYVSINGNQVGGLITGTTDQQNADAVFTQSIVSGENTIMINVGDFGGLNGFNFRIDLTVDSQDPLEEVEVDPDTVAPVVTVPADITAEATGPDGAVVSFTVSAEDDFDGSVPAVADPASGSTFPLGTTVVGVGASDSAGNFGEAYFNVTIVDTIAPVVAAPADITTEATGPAGATVNFGATATDIVDGNVAVVALPASGSTFPLGTTTVDLGATDNAGNFGEANFSITVVDTTAPVVSAPADITAEATGPTGAAVSFSATATDIVDGSVAVISTPASGSTFALGTTAVGLTATDSAGNTGDASFNVTIVDTTAPVIASVTPSTATLWSPNHKMVPITVTVDATDLVGVTSVKIISVVSNEPDNGKGDGNTVGDIVITGDLSVNLRAERDGRGTGRVYTITVEVTDAAGNATTATCTVSVPKSQGKSYKDKSSKDKSAKGSPKSDKSDKKSDKKAKGKGKS